MNTIIFGASGFIGREIFNSFKKRNMNCIGTRYSSKDANLLKFDFNYDSVKEIVPESFLREYEENCAIITSAVSNIDQCLKNKEESYALNVTSTTRIIDELNELNFKIVFLSSDAVFDGKKGYYSEEMPAWPINEYGRHKIAIERYIAKNVKNGLVFRLGKIVGHESTGKHMFANWLKTYENQGVINCIKGQIIAPTSVRDVANGIIAALERDLKGLYHLSNSEFFLRRDLARLFIDAIGIDILVREKELEDFSLAEKRGINLYLDGTKFRRDCEIQFTSMSEVFKEIRKDFIER